MAAERGRDVRDRFALEEQVYAEVARGFAFAAEAFQDLRYDGFWAHEGPGDGHVPVVLRRGLDEEERAG